MNDDSKRTLLGKQVKVYIGDEGNEKIIVRGQLLAFGQGGDFEILCDDGAVHFCWPMLKMTEER